MKTRILICIAVSWIIFSNAAVAAQVVVNYTESTADFLNPDRGFYYPYTTRTSNFVALPLSDLQSRRANPYMGFGATYSVQTTLALRHYVLDSLKNTTTLPAWLLSNIQSDFNTARSAGVRLILRFSYTNIEVDGTCMAGRPCPPYGDAPKSIVLGHLNQLGGVLQTNADVILGVQLGLIGIYGEGYYTDYYGDASVNGQRYLTDQNWLDRNELVQALLNAAPANRMVQLRYPQAKQRFLNGPNAALTTPAIGERQAHNGSDIARLGLHNDCFLASVDDFGTYADYGNDASPVAASAVTTLKPYAAAEGDFVLVGGETCSDAYSPPNDCASAGGTAVAEMAAFNYTYLNTDYNNEVNNDWLMGGCLDDIKRRLGYRFVLTQAALPDVATAGERLAVSINVQNAGFAAPVNQRQLYLVMRNVTTNDEFKIPFTDLSADTRFWLAGETQNVSQSLAIPEHVTPGDYSLWLHLADTSNNGAIENRSEYSVRFANENVWKSNTGYNALNHTVSVSSGDFDILFFIPAIIKKKQ